MRILYLSCHSVLEFDEVSLLHELGHEVFSPGAYVEPANPGDPTTRPGINMLNNPDDKAVYDLIGQMFPGEDGKDHLTKEVIDRFDAVIIMHIPRWIHHNWEIMKHKRVIWRTIGQSVTHTEESLRRYREEGLHIVRYSPYERRIPTYIGENATIRFYKDPNEYGPWNGCVKEVMTLAQSMKQRGEYCGFDIFNQSTHDIPRKLYGISNEDSGIPGGKLEYSVLKQAMRDHGCYFNTGTHPASYVLNTIESLMSGMPLVSIDNGWGNSRHFPDCKLFETADLLRKFDAGLVSDDSNRLNIWIKEILTNDQTAQKLSQNGRAMAIKLFGKETIKEQWKNYLDSL